MKDMGLELFCCIGAGFLVFMAGLTIGKSMVLQEVCQVKRVECPASETIELSPK